MGQIVNQMALEMFYKIKEHMKEKKEEKRQEVMNLSDEELTEIDQLAELMLEPDTNFSLLQEIWNQNEKFRILRGGLN